MMTVKGNELLDLEYSGKKKLRSGSSGGDKARKASGNARRGSSCLALLK
jgi:hypothetical protein